MRPLQKLLHVTVVVTLALGIASCGDDASHHGGSAGSGGSGGAKPAAPSMLTAMPLSGGAHLTWKDNSSDEEMFMIMRKEGSGNFATLTMIPFDMTQYHDATTMTGKTYTFMVHAMRGSALSDPSNEAMVTIP